MTAAKYRVPACCFPCSPSRCRIAFAQARSLRPARRPACSMTLQQVEPRTPISSLRFSSASPARIISRQSNRCRRADGITITAPDVTLDLMGFELRGVGGSLERASS